MTSIKSQKQLRIEREAKALQKNLDKRKKQKAELEKLKGKVGKGRQRQDKRQGLLYCFWF